MPIEFRCVTCQKLLRVADNAAGKKARCPDCGTIQETRPSSDHFAAPLPPLEPVRNPFSSAAELAPPTNPFSEHSAPVRSNVEAAANPYLAPFSTGSRLPASLESIRAKVQFPATGMLVVAALGITVQLVTLLVAFVAAAQGGRGVDILSSLVGPAIGLGLGISIISGAVKMQRLQSYRLAVTAGILSLLPCTPCCLLSVPFGVWSLIVLSDPEVRSAFS